MNTIRTLSMDAVQKANSGHPGTPMALAPLAYVLWIVAAGLMGACPASCDDNNSCTTDSTSGSVLDCTRTCSHAPITACTSGDRCCPTGCPMATDSDCDPVCGNGLAQTGEGFRKWSAEEQAAQK